MNKEEEPNWENVAKCLHKALSTCMNNLKSPPGSSGMIGRFSENGEFNMKHWREEVADALERFPGCKVDRDACHALDLPKKQRDAFFKERDKT